MNLSSCRGESQMFKINWYQGSVLADRYLETILSDWKNTLLLLVQAPALAGMAVAVELTTVRRLGSDTMGREL